MVKLTIKIDGKFDQIVEMPKDRVEPYIEAMEKIGGSLGYKLEIYATERGKCN